MSDSTDPSSVVHTGMKSFGCEKRMAHDLHRAVEELGEDRGRDVGSSRLVRVWSAEERAPLDVRVPVDGAVC